MTHNIDRRGFLQRSAAAAAGARRPFRLSPLGPRLTCGGASRSFRISLAEWSLHRALFRHEVKNLDFPVIAKREYGIGACEYVNQFFKDKADDGKYLAELNRRAAGEGVQNVLIMIDDEGALGDPDPQRGPRRSIIITSGSTRPRRSAATRFASMPTARARTTNK